VVNTAQTAPSASHPSCEYVYDVQTALLITMHSAYAQAYPKTVDSAFQTHWYFPHELCGVVITNLTGRSTWFTQADVNTFVKAGLNTVRIPVSDRIRSIDSHAC
jgi:aryl-phospho-beta-D-glucosidase BglC (GH1 family)